MTPPGNQFWKLRSRHGREKIFASPEALMKAAEEYFEQCGDNPFPKYDVIKSGHSAGKLVAVPVQRPFTIAGFCVFVGVNDKYFLQFKNSIIDRDDEESKKFLEVISFIETVMYANKFEGAAVGAFNANIISRDLGLVDKSDLMLETGHTFTALLERAQQRRLKQNDQDEQIQ